MKALQRYVGQQSRSSRFWWRRNVWVSVSECVQGGLALLFFLPLTFDPLTHLKALIIKQDFLSKERPTSLVLHSCHRSSFIRSTLQVLSHVSCLCFACFPVDTLLVQIKIAVCVILFVLIKPVLGHENCFKTLLAILLTHLPFVCLFEKCHKM